MSFWRRLWCITICLVFLCLHIFLLHFDWSISTFVVSFKFYRLQKEVSFLHIKGINYSFQKMFILSNFGVWCIGQEQSFMNCCLYFLVFVGNYSYLTLHHWIEFFLFFPMILINHGFISFSPVRLFVIEVLSKIITVGGWYLFQNSLNIKSNCLICHFSSLFILFHFFCRHSSQWFLLHILNLVSFCWVGFWFKNIRIFRL